MVDVTRLKAGMIIAQFEGDWIIPESLMIVTIEMELTAEAYAKRGTPYLPNFSIVSLHTDWISYNEFDMPNGINWYDVITDDGRLWIDQDSNYIESVMASKSKKFIRLTPSEDWVDDPEICLVRKLTQIE